MKKAALILSVVLGMFPVQAQPNRTSPEIDKDRRVVLAGHIHPKSLAGVDQGSVDPSSVMSLVTVMLQPSAAQQTQLEELLNQQQQASSPNYHRWLTPTQFADRFGVSESDLDQIRTWLGTQSLTVVAVAQARNWVVVSGTAGAVQQAFGVDIHRYLVDGESHYANVNEPSVPAGLQGAITSIRGLTDFRLKPARRFSALASIPATPQYANSSLCATQCLGPDDLATIYDYTPLFNSGWNGSGQTIVVVGQTDIVTTDIQQYRTFFHLPALNLQRTLVPGSPDPGISASGDLGESDLDIEMAGAVARKATIRFVYSTDVMSSAQYAIDQNLGPVLTISYGDCEAAFTQSEAHNLQTMAQQANAEGITWFAAAGDSGATGCYGDGAKIDSMVSVDLPASLPEVTAVGGTEFNEGSGKYWSTSNTATNASALSYIPEVAWNDSATDGSPAASGGGASMYFSKPSWQAGNGVPNDGARDVPDVSMSASADHDGYVIFSSDPNFCHPARGALATCEVVIGGTSVGSPAFAGLAALVNQAVVSKGIQANSGLGNINPVLYGLFHSSPSPYHDITSGNNIINVVCPPRQSSCKSGPAGYSAGSGYDQVTGIGSVDADTLLTAWFASLNAPATSSAAPSITGIVNNGSYQQTYAPGEILSIFGSNLASTIQSATELPLPTQLGSVTVTINGVASPLWYVSATQLNLQVPYETPVDTGVDLIVTNNGQSTAKSFTAAAAAPGIYVDQQNAPLPYTSAARNQTITLFLTGAGVVTPLPADGAAPAALTVPIPAQTVTMTVGGVNAPIEGMGIPSWSTGILQINYQVPAGAPLGAQSVVVSIGGIASNAATLTVTAQ